MIHSHGGCHTLLLFRMWLERQRQCYQFLLLLRQLSISSTRLARYFAPKDQTHDGEVVEQTEEVLDLGVTINNRLNFSKHRTLLFVVLCLVIRLSGESF